MKIMDKYPDVTTGYCEQHGEYEFKVTEMPIGPKFMVVDGCPECARLEQEEADRLAAEEAKAQEAQDLIRRKQSAGLRKRHMTCSLDNYKATTESQKTALGEVRAFLSNVLSGKGGNMVLAGRVGTGKTHLAAGVISALTEAKYHCKIIKLPELIRAIKSSWANGSDLSESEIIHNLSGLKLLIVDEIGVQYGSDTEKLLLSEIIDNRYQEMLPTMLISNLDVDGIRKCIGERCYDRLKEDGGKVVAFDWESARGAA